MKSFRCLPNQQLINTQMLTLITRSDLFGEKLLRR